MHLQPSRQAPEANRAIVWGSCRIPILAAGRGWLVVTKPIGISVHNDPGMDLISAVQMAFRNNRLPEFDRPQVSIHAVHRLDRETSGIVLLAGDSETASFFGRQFADRSVRKIYLAILHGHPVASGGHKSWDTWTAALSAAAGGRGNPKGGRPHVKSVTRWRIKQQTMHYSLVEVQPLTGRKHQIRRHAKLAGHPVIGDRRYGSSRSISYLARHCNFDRLGLHAHALTIRLPDESAARTFRSPGLPASMARLLEADR